MTLRYSMAAFAASARIGLGGDSASARGALIRKAALAVAVGGSGVGMLALASASSGAGRRSVAERHLSQQHLLTQRRRVRATTASPS